MWRRVAGKEVEIPREVKGSEGWERLLEISPASSGDAFFLLSYKEAQRGEGKLWFGFSDAGNWGLVGNVTETVLHKEREL